MTGNKWTHMWIEEKAKEGFEGYTQNHLNASIFQYNIDMEQIQILTSI